MKEGWEYKKLDDICTIVGRIGFRGYTKADLVDSPNDGAITLSPSNITNGELDFSKCTYISWDKYNESPEIMLTKGDVVLVKTASIGKCAVVKELPHKATLNPQFVVLKGIIGEPNFIGYYLKSPVAQITIKQMAGGVAIPTLSQKKLGTMLIPSPPLSEQQSIVDYLDSAFAKIDAMEANAEKALNEAKTLFQASLKEMLEPKEGWEEKKLKELCETITDFVAAGSFASLRENVVYNNEKDYAQLVRTTDLKSGFSKGGYVYVNEHAFKYLYRVNLDKECIILPNVGVNCGEVYFVTPSILPYNNNVLGPNAVLVRSNNYSNHFLSYLFLGKDFQNKLSDITSHMAQPKFNKTGLKEIVISVPPQSEQQSIVATLDSLKSKVDRLQANYDKISQECDALKQAILRQVFE